MYEIIVDVFIQLFFLILLYMSIAAEIIPGLWIGNYAIYKNEHFHYKKKIDLTINCDIPCLYKDTQIDNKVFYNYAIKALPLIHRNLFNLKTILVYCNDSNKASALVAGYLIRYAKIKTDCAINLIRDKNLSAFSNGIYYKRALIKIARSGR